MWELSIKGLLTGPWRWKVFSKVLKPTLLPENLEISLWLKKFLPQVESRSRKHVYSLQVPQFPSSCRVTKFSSIKHGIGPSRTICHLFRQANGMKIQKFNCDNLLTGPWHWKVFSKVLKPTMLPENSEISLWLKKFLPQRSIGNMLHSLKELHLFSSILSHANFALHQGDL